MYCNVAQTIHGTSPVIRVAVAVDDASKNVRQTHWELQRMRITVFSKHKPHYRSNGFKPAAAA
jgi:hypothetical protein